MEKIMSVVTDIINLAAKHADANDSATLVLNDARETEANGRDEDAAGRALESLRYSVGVFHPDYALAHARACSQWASFR
jgi:hypothetical protein